MLKSLAITGAGVLVCALTFAAVVSPKRSVAPKKSAAVKKSGSSKKSASSKSGKKGGTTRTAQQTWRNRQLQPAPERYKQIQEALASKGYLQGEPTGVWNSASVDALRRFQEDQKIEATGKIDSLSLIALGLGPKYDTATTAMPARAPAEQP